MCGIQQSAIKTARIHNNERQRNCRWLSCAHMFELRTLFTLIEEHRNVLPAAYCYLFHSARTQTHTLIFLVVSGTYHTSYTYTTIGVGGASGSIIQCMCDGCLPREEKKFVTSPDTLLAKYVNVYHKSNHLPVCMKRLIGTSCVSVCVCVFFFWLLLLLL